MEDGRKVIRARGTSHYIDEKMAVQLISTPRDTVQHHILHYRPQGNYYMWAHITGSMYVRSTLPRSPFATLLPERRLLCEIAVFAIAIGADESM